MSRIETLAEGVTLYPGDCLDVLAALEPNSIDSCVTDPPYHLTSIVKRFGNEKSNLERDPATLAAPIGRQSQNPYGRVSRGFMGKKWDGGDIAFRPETWDAVYRVLKPGGHLLAFSGTRTYHNMVTAIESAGFEIRDQIGWCYGSGFPKSHNAGDGWGTALKPAWEPIVLARKPLEGTVAANVLKWGTGAINIDGCRVGVRERPKVTDPKRTSNTYGEINSPGGKLLPDARWPANIIHDGSEEVVGAFPDTGLSGVAVQRNGGGQKIGNTVYSGSGGGIVRPDAGFADGGSAARFFYTAKADSDDRLGSKHPTVKPVDLIQYLVRLVTPRGGLCLDLFAGTGTLGEACIREGMRAVLIEREEEYQADIRRRMKLAMAGPDERVRESMRAKNPNPDLGPLFSDYVNAK